VLFLLIQKSGKEGRFKSKSQWLWRELLPPEKVTFLLVMMVLVLLLLLLLPVLPS